MKNIHEKPHARTPTASAATASAPAAALPPAPLGRPCPACCASSAAWPLSAAAVRSSDLVASLMLTPVVVELSDAVPVSRGGEADSPRPSMITALTGDRDLPVLRPGEHR